MTTVAVLGNATLDVTHRVESLPRPGETILAVDTRRCAGGKGLNQALAAARCGAAVLLTAPVGGDAEGAFLRDTLAREPGLMARWIEVAAATDVSTILVSREGENMIVSTAAAAHALAPETARDAGARLAPGDVLVLQGNLTPAATLAGARAARAAGALTVLNTAPLAWDMREILPLVDLVVANEPEALALTGERGEAALARLRQAGAARAVISLGPRGAVLAQPEGGGAIPAPAVTALDTSGAGDVLVGVLAAELASGAPLAPAVTLAVAAASLSVTRAGTTPSFPTSDEIARLRARP